jgi:hypothetical protein
MILETDELTALLGAKPSFSPATVDSDRTPLHCFRCSIDMALAEDAQGRVFDRCEICEAVFIDWGQV